MNKSRFVRKGGSNKQSELAKEKYDKFLISAFRIFREDLDYQEKMDIIQNDYASIADLNIERNETFLERLAALKDQVQTKPDSDAVQYFIEILLLLYQSNIISHVDFIELAEVQRKSESLVYQVQEQEIVKKNLLDFKQSEVRKENPVDNLIQFKSQTDLEDANLMQYIDSMLESPDIRRRKEAILANIGEIFNKVNFDCLEHGCQTTYTIYGSHVNEISLPSSDIDISLDTDYSGDPRDLLKFFLREIRAELSDRYDFEVDQFLAQKVSVPVIDIYFKDFDITISFSVNNKLGVINSRLLRIYSRLDKRCKMLCLAVKLWAKANGVISAKENYLSSYAYNLMVINFLQTRNPPILPSLQKLRIENLLAEPEYITIKRKNSGGRVENFRTRVDFEDDVKRLEQLMRQEYSGNKATVVELLKEFFAFYGNQDNFDEITLSIKEGKHLRRDPFNHDRSFLYSIEDPFDLLRNAGRHVKNTVVHENYAKKILQSMQRAKALLENGNTLEIFDLDNVDEDL